MFKIGEFSKLTQVSVRMLRYYDSVGLLPPAYVEPLTGYRLYSNEQIRVLNKIIFLRDTGFHVSEISALLNNPNESDFIEGMKKKQHEIHQTISAEQDKLDKIFQALQDINTKEIAIHYNVVMKSIPEYKVLSLRKIIPDFYAEATLWAELGNYIHSQKIPVSQETFSIYHDTEFKETDVDVELCVFTSKTGKNEGNFNYRTTDAVPMMASTMVSGPFSNISGAFNSFAGWLNGHQQYEMSGPNRQIVHRGPWNEASPEMYLTEILIPLKKK